MQLLIAQNRVAPVRPVLLRLRAVQPESIPSLREQLARKLIPEEVARRGIGRVVDVRSRNLKPLPLDLLEVL